MIAKASAGLLTVVSLAVASPAAAQRAEPQPVLSASALDDLGEDIGMLGLIGLIGLFGLKRRGEHRRG
jgi:hypothetical protein